MAKGNKKKRVPPQTIPEVPRKKVPDEPSFRAATQYEKTRFKFSSSQIDLDVGPQCGCAWEWGPGNLIWRDVLHYLNDFSGKTWAEIEAERTGGRNRHKKHHSMEVASLPKEARNRLGQHLGDDAPDTLFRFRLSGTNRLWGIRDGAIFHILWFDADHQVYPTEPN